MALLEKISDQEKADLVKNLSLLIESGKPVNESFGLLADQARSKYLKEMLEEAQDKTEKGTALHQIFEDSPHFGSVFVSFIRAGEESGTLDENLEHLANWLERRQELSQEISSATLYPKIILVFGGILGAVLAVFILPQLIPVFDQLDVELPVTTRFLLWITDIIEAYGIRLLVGLVAFIGVIYGIFKKVRPVRKRWDGIKIKIPVLGMISKEYQLTIIAQLVTTLFQSGLTLNESLEIIADSVTNIQYEEALLDIKRRVRKGTSFADTMREYPDLFPGIFISVVATGEQTGTYGSTFQYLADFFSQSVTNRTQKLPTVLEPVLLITIGVFVAFIASAIILPIYEVTQGLY